MSSSEKTLVIVLSETRAAELTFDTFKTNVVERLDADVCVCIGAKPDYDETNPYFQMAKYRFVVPEPEDYGILFEEAYHTILSNAKAELYEKLENVNLLHNLVSHPRQSRIGVQSYGKSGLKRIPLNADAIVMYGENCEPIWKNEVVGISSSLCQYIKQEGVVSWKKRLYWREFLKLKDQFMGGVKDATYQHEGSAGILIYMRWLLLQKIREHGLLEKYDRFLITRSDFMHLLPHPSMNMLDPSCIWIPNEEHYGGYTDRQVVLSKQHVEGYLNIFENMVLKSNPYFLQMKNTTSWNLERVIKFHLQQNELVSLVKEYPYTMYSVRNNNGSTRWRAGNYDN